MGDENTATPSRSIRWADRPWIDPENLLNVFEHSPDGLLIGRPDGLVFHANSKACEIFGGSEEDLCRAGRAGLTYPSDRRMPVVLEERRRTGRASGVVPLHRLDGTPFLGELRSVVFETPKHEQRSLVIVRDVTEQVFNERRLEAYDEIAEALLAARKTPDVLELVAHHARVIFDSDVAVISSVDPDGNVTVTAVDGENALDLLGRQYPSGGAVQRVIESKQALAIDDFAAVAQFETGRKFGVGPALAVPVANSEVFGILLLGRTTGVPYGPDDLARATQFALRAGLVITIGHSRAERERQQALTAEQLQTALNTRIVIEQAKGIIAATRNIDVDAAFDQLRKYARSHSVGIHEVAAKVVQRTLLP